MLSTKEAGSGEIHLFIIWESAREREEEILRDLSSKFKILTATEITWSNAKFAENLSRFYGKKLPGGFGHEKHRGEGPFLAVVVQDVSPIYNVHETSRGPEYVNSNTFLAKTENRARTGGGHRVHATNDPKETDHDLALLFGLNTKDYLEKHKNQDPLKIKKVKQDLAGANGWKNLEELFYILNATIDYVVLRNFDPLPDAYYAKSHGDIDLLVSDYHEAKWVTNARAVFPQEWRVYSRIKIGRDDVLFDFRHIGDNYYDESWQKQILANARPYKGFYIPETKDQLFSLLYHAHLHKKSVSPDYQRTFAELAQKCSIDADKLQDEPLETLGQYMRIQKYKVTRPIDSSVIINEANFKKLKKLTSSWRRHLYWSG